MRRLILLAAAVLRAQSSDPVDRVTAVMQKYARAMTELTFDVQVKISDFEPGGKLRRVRQMTHRMSFTRGRYRGVDPTAQSDWESTIQVTHAGRGTLGLEMFTDRGVWDPVFAFAPHARSAREWTYETSAPREVQYRSSAPCQTFEPGGRGFRFSAKLCGSGQVTLDEGSGRLIRTSFQAEGLPLQFGKELLRAYRTESRYGTVTLPGSGEPYMVPQSAVTTLEFGKGRVTVEASYTLRPQRK